MSHPTALHIAPGLTIPANFATETCGIIARKGAGKTHTGVVLAEELLAMGVQIVVIDPLGVWWGLRSSNDGTGKGFPVIVFGGDHGDLPLTEDMGKHLAEAIVDQHLSAVLDTSALRKGATKRFVTAFAERLYELKHPEAKRTPLHIFIDEADMFAPQRVQPDDARMLGIIDEIVRRGRVRGIGETMITQRPATINKDVLTQIEILISLQISSPQDRKAVDEWIQANATSDERDEFMGSLASMEKGQAWVWSPQFLKCFKRVQIRQRKTFDSSRTPTAGERPKAPKQMAAVDLDQLRTVLAESLAKAVANDPELLKKQIAGLEHRIVTLTRELKGEREKPAPGPSSRDIALQLGQAVTARDQQWKARIQRMLAAAQVDLDLPSYVAVNAPEIPRPAPARAAIPQPITTTVARTGDALLGKGERAILTVLAQAGKPCSRNYIAMRAGYSVNGGSFQTYLSRLRTAERIASRSADEIVATSEGLQVLGTWAPLPSGRELVAYWIRELGKGEASILNFLANVHPESVSREALGRATGYEHTGGSFQTYLSRLRTLGLIEGRGDDLRASAELMEDA